MGLRRLIGSGRNRVAFTPFTDYRTGDFIKHGGMLVFAIQPFTSDAAYDPTDWVETVDGGAIGVDPATVGQPLGLATLNASGVLSEAQRQPGNANAVVIPWTVEDDANGDVQLGAGARRLYLPTAGEIRSIKISSVTAPTGDGIIVDVNKNGETLFTNQANRPVIPSGLNKSVLVVPDVTTFSIDDYLTLDVDGVGTAPPAGTVTFVSDTVQATSTNVSSYDVTRPTTIDVGYVHLLSLRTNLTADLITPAGWTAVGSVVGANTPAPGMHVTRFMRVDDGTPGPWTFTNTSGTIDSIFARHVVYAGTHATLPINTSASEYTGGVGPITPAQLTTSVTNCVIVYQVILSGGAAAELPTGYTARTGFAGLGAFGTTRHLADKLQAAAGASDQATLTLSTARNKVITRTALRPSAAPATVKGSRLSAVIRYVET